MREIIFALLFLCATYPLQSYSQTCDRPKSPEDTRVYYVNGMNNTPLDRRAGVNALSALVNKSSHSYGESINDLESGIAQLIEVFKQRDSEPTQFWEWMANLSIAPNWFKKAYSDYVVQNANMSYITDADLKAMVDQYVLDLRSGKKVILVSHSQGNFYANSAYQFISQNLPHYADSIGQVAVATPSARVQSGGPYTQNLDDVVISTVNKFYAVLTPNFSYNSPIDSLNHNFINTYLNSQGTKIRSDILSVESSLKTPQKHPDCDLTAKIQTKGVSLITHNSATIEGNLTAGGQVDAWLVYGTNLVQCFSSGYDGIGKFTAPTPVIVNLNNLKDSTTYFYRACAIGRDKKLSSGSLEKFKTLVNPTPPPPPTPIIPCSNMAYRGGNNGLLTIFDFGTKKGLSNIAFQAYTIPDKFEIYKHNTKIKLLYTSGFVSGLNYGSFTVDDTFSKVDVVVTGNGNTSTVWDLTVNCPN